MTELDEYLEIDRKKIRNAIKLQLPIEILSYILPRNMEVYIQKVTDAFLEECHQEHLKEYINFCLSELLINAKKANTKRVYFHEKNLNIFDPKEYEEGMQSFKEETLENINYYLELQRKAGLYVKLAMRLTDDNVIIEIKNNSKLTPFENERIQDKIRLAHQYKSMEEVVTNVIDQQEGAGLGIIIIILMLKRIGLTKDNYQVFSNDEETITRILLPCNKTIFAGVEMISYEFISMQEKIPVIQSHAEKAMKIVSKASDGKGKIDRDELIKIVARDLPLTLLTFKYSFQKDKTCLKIEDALSLLSDEELKFIYSESNPSCAYIDSTDEIESLLLHSERTAFFAYNLFKNNNGLHKYIDADVMYTLGLFSALGFFLLETATEEQKKYINELAAQYDNLMEKIVSMFTNGYASTFIKRVYTKRFGLADDISCLISSWNSIEKIQEENKFSAKVLYLAEMMQYYDEKSVDFYQIDKALLTDFKISDEKQFNYLIKLMKEAHSNYYDDIE